VAVTSMANSSISDFVKYNRMSSYLGTIFPASLKYVLVGGGGAGNNAPGAYASGGGGGGGYRCSDDDVPLEKSLGDSFTVTIEAGGAANGGAGASSVLDGLTSNGGAGAPSGTGGASGAPTSFSGGARSGLIGGGGGGAGQAGTAAFEAVAVVTVAMVCPTRCPGRKSITVAVVAALEAPTTAAAAAGLGGSVAERTGRRALGPLVKQTLVAVGPVEATTGVSTTEGTGEAA